MKKTLYLVLAAMFLAATACTIENVQPPQVEHKVFLEASIFSDQTKTVRDETDNKVYWEPGDAISLFFESGTNGGSKFVSTSEQLSRTVKFVGTINAFSGGTETSFDESYFWGLYPYDENASCDGTSITMSLPSEQLARGGSFASGLYPSIGKSLGLKMSFRNICGGLKFSLTRDDIKRIVFQTTDGSPVAGRATIGFGDDGNPIVEEMVEGSSQVILAPDGNQSFESGKNYYMVLFPQQLSSGFTLTFFTDTEQGVFEWSKPVTFKRNVFSTVSEIDKNITFTRVIDENSFPDENFRQYVLDHFDNDEDGTLSSEEIEAVTEIEVCTDDIVSLKGIEYFSELSHLNCCGTAYHNGYYYAGNGLLSELDVSKNTKLEVLSCTHNQLQSLDVSHNSNLVYLHCGSNFLTELDVRSNAILKELDFQDNQLTSIDLSNNPELTGLDFCRNSITSISLSANPKLERLICWANGLTELDVSDNTKLKRLEVENNQIQVLDVSANLDLVSLVCFGNPSLTELWLSCGQSIEQLTYDSEITIIKYKGAVEIPDANFRAYCIENFDSNHDGLISLAEAESVTTITVDTKTIASMTGIESFTNLESLSCRSNSIIWDAELQRNVGTGLLTELDISSNIALKRLDCAYNHLTSLNVSSNVLLEQLHCGQNLLTEIDITNNPVLSVLECDNNQLTELDVTRNGELSFLHCKVNSINTLNLTDNSKLTWLDCDDNTIAELNVSSNRLLTYLHCSNNLLHAIDISNNTAMTKLWCDGNELSSLDISNNTELIEVSCYGTALSSLDVSNNLNLKKLDCQSNPLLNTLYLADGQVIEILLKDEHTNIVYAGMYAMFPDDIFRQYVLDYFDGNEDGWIDPEEIADIKSIRLCYKGITSLQGIERFPALESLVCYGNQLTSLDLSNNPQLNYLSCDANSITQLDLSNNPLLTYVNCGNNNLSSLNVSTCTSLSELTCDQNSLTRLDVSACPLSRLQCHNNPRLSIICLSDQNCDYLRYDDEIAILRYENDSDQNIRHSIEFVIYVLDHLDDFYSAGDTAAINSAFLGFVTARKDYIPYPDDGDKNYFVYSSGLDSENHPIANSIRFEEISSEMLRDVRLEYGINPNDSTQEIHYDNCFENIATQLFNSVIGPLFQYDAVHSISDFVSAFSADSNNAFFGNTNYKLRRDGNVVRVSS